MHDITIYNILLYYITKTCSITVASVLAVLASLIFTWIISLLAGWQAGAYHRIINPLASKKDLIDLQWRPHALIIQLSLE